MKKVICKECGIEHTEFESYEQNVMELARRLTEEEVLSLLKSNVFSWSLRKQIKLLLIPSTIIKLIPMIAAIAMRSLITASMIEVIEKTTEEEKTK